MKVLLVSNEGGGSAGYEEVVDGSTVGDLFTAKMGGRSPDNFMVAVNREKVAMSHRLQDGDRVSFTPTKIEGA